ncbi:MAG: glycosyltransferase [Chromatiales bacterium]|jgi:hypothetical protein
MNLALFLPKDNNFYRSLFAGIQRAFTDHGVHVFGQCGLLDDADLASYCHQHRIDVIFEMNRSRASVPGLPSDIRHIGWLVDLWGEFSNYTGSDLMYVFCQPWIDALKTVGEKRAKWLSPGIDRSQYFAEQQSLEYLSDIAFLGHIPKPYSDEELARTVKVLEHRRITFADLVQRCRETKDQLGGFHNLHGYYPKMVDFFLENPLDYNRFGTHIKDPLIKYDVEIRTVRMFLRQELIDCARQISDSIRIFGSENWQLWPQYRDMYHCFLDDTESIRQVYVSSKINLHDGEGMHFRSLDCMASGGLLAYYSKYGKSNLKNRTLFKYFTPWKDFIPINFDNSEKVKRCLNDEDRRLRIAENGQQKVLQEHTWHHRAERILDDLGRL